MTSAIDILSNPESGIASVIAAINEIEKTNGYSSVCSFGLSANITINDLATEIKRQCFLYNHRPDVHVGNYRDHVGNAEMFAALGMRHVLFMWFFDAIIPSLGVRAANLSVPEASDVRLMFTKEVHAVLGYSEKFEHVYPKLPNFYSVVDKCSACNRLCVSANAIIIAYNLSFLPPIPWRIPLLILHPQ